MTQPLLKQRCFPSAGPSVDHKDDWFSAVWAPGSGCPVLGCGAKFCRNRSDLRSHWLEKHEKIAAHYHCALCSNVAFKRKSNLFAHIRGKHGVNVKEFIGKVEFYSNSEFINPFPLTLNAVLGLKWIRQVSVYCFHVCFAGFPVCAYT